MDNSSPTDDSAVYDYFQAKVRRWGTEVDAARWGRSDVFERARRAILDGLLRLDSLPRSDPLWRPWANDRATLAKLGDYLHRWRQESPADPDAIWLAAALHLYYYDNGFGADSWRALHRLGQFDPAWAIDAAGYVERSSGVPTVAPLIALLRDCAQAKEARKYLLRLSADDDSGNRSWARIVLAALGS